MQHTKYDNEKQKLYSSSERSDIKYDVNFASKNMIGQPSIYFPVEIFFYVKKDNKKQTEQEFSLEHSTLTPQNTFS